MKRTVIITGGTKGLGREMALAFGRAGYFVMALYGTDEEAARRLESAFVEIGINGSAIKHDVASESTSAWNHPEIQSAECLTLIHNAGAPFSPVPLQQLGWPDFESHFKVAIRGGWLCSQALIRPMLKKKRGTIVNVLTSAIEGFPPRGFGAYVTAKHALRGFTLALAAEYAPRGIRIFSISPGFMNTSLTESWDLRLKEAIRSSARISEPVVAGQRVVTLVESDEVAGKGEDYQV